MISANRRERIRLNSVTRVKRGLGKAVIGVRINQEVSPLDTLGVAQGGGGFAALNLAKSLGVEKSGADKYLQRVVGNKIFKGELLALKKGVFGQKVVTSPTDGVIDHYDVNTGEIYLKYATQSSPLNAGVYGIIEEIDKEAGEVVIKTMATQIFGMMGVGREYSGTIHILGNASTLINQNQLRKEVARQIIVTGALIYGETLKKAAALGVHGVISGGLNARDFHSMTGSFNPHQGLGTNPGLAVLATEGFGPLPIGQDVFSLLAGHSGKFAILAGNSGRLILPSSDPDSIMTLRKVALPKGQDTKETAIGRLEKGIRVRVVMPPFASYQGEVESIDQERTILPSGISTFMVVIKTTTRKIKVPYLNLEII